MDQSKLKKLWLLVLEGDEKAFAKIYDSQVEKIYRFVFLKVSSAEIAEEITQDVFLKLWKAGSDKNKKVNNIAAFLYQIARFSVVDYYRAKNSEDSELRLDDFENDLELSKEDGVAEALDIEYDFLEVKEALLKLPEIYKDIIIMKYLDDLTNEEIAEALGKEEGNVRVLIHRAMAALRKKMNKEE